MIRAFLVGLIGAISIAFVSHDNETAKAVERKEKLSEYSFFKGKLSELQPADGVTAYAVNAPLFSNYAEKIRFIKVPEGATVPYNDSIAFDFPVGTVAIKNFFYFNDFRKPSKGRKIIETRLLVHNESG